uniref:cytochrome b n=1 Tax=Arion flagellus TaxID=236857 RepID=UPI00240FB4CD|nr:cytochrome b [Arion flagellus]WES82236.1 cytochrome b [Arion flagellus]
MQKIREIEHMLALPSPGSFSIWWNGGSILGILLMIQILTGLLLSMHYTADLENTFNSIIHIMRDVPSGWLTRSVHANGASLFFLFMYIHIGRGIYYQSYNIQLRTWLLGVTIFLISMATAFLGYVLPWGQMSFWGATVITNLLSAIPYWGGSLVEWVWGGFSVGQPTLNRFFTLHFLLPFVLLMLVLLHLLMLHEKGSTSPLGDINHINKITFHPYYTWKDVVGFLIVLMVLGFMCSFYPNLLVDPENYIKANPMITPTHIQPEWYFLFAYAILRTIPSKLGGVVALAMSIIILYLLPFLSKKWMSPMSMLFFRQLGFWVLTASFIMLTWLGACVIEQPYQELSILFTLIYFGGFISIA